MEPRPEDQHVLDGIWNRPRVIELPEPPPPPPPPRQRASDGPAIEDGYDPPPRNDRFFDLWRGGATTLLTEDAGDARANCLDKAVDLVNGLDPAERQNAELVILQDTRPGGEGRTGHVVVRQGDQVIDPATGKRYANTADYLEGQPHYLEAGTIEADRAKLIFDAPAGSPERARAIQQAGVSPALTGMMLADNDAGGGGGDASLAARVALYGPEILPDRAGSEAAGRRDGDSLRKAMEEYDRWKPMPGVGGIGVLEKQKETKDALLAELNKVSQHRDDPAYAAALLSTVGKDNLKELFESYPISYGATNQDHHAMVPGAMEQMKKELGPLVETFYTADKSGMLSPEVRQEMLNLSPQALSTFLRMGPQDRDFSRDAGKVILGSPPVPSRDSAVHNFLLSYPDPRVLLELAADEKRAGALLNFSGLAYSGDYPQVLARQLGAAFESDLPGSSDHQAAMGNVIKLTQDGDLRTAIGGEPELAAALAESFKPYIKDASFLQAQDLAANYEQPVAIRPHDGPKLPSGIGTDEIATFFGALVRSEPAREILAEEVGEQVQSGALAEFFSKPENLQDDRILSPEFRERLLSDLGLVSLYAQGIKVSDLDDDAKRAFMASTINTLLVGYGTLPFGKSGPVVAVGVDPAAGASLPVSQKLTDLIMGKDDISPEDFRQELKKEFAGAFLAVLNEQNSKLPPDQRLSADNVAEIGRIAEDAFNSAVLVEIQEIAQDD
jgi:hypothetical protein